MRNSKIDTSKLRLARIKMYDSEAKGSEFFPTGVDVPYVFLYNVNGTYINLLNPLDDYPVCKKTPYALCDKNGEDYGVWMVHVSGDLNDGPFYLMDAQNSRVNIFSEDEIDMETLKEYIIRSNKFFIDRLSILESLPVKERFKYRELIRKDSEKHNKFEEYVTSYEKGYQYVIS